MSVQIPLSRGLFATVDDEYADWVNQWKWYASDNRPKRNAPHPDASKRTAGGKAAQVSLLLYRELWVYANGPIPLGCEIDHEDRDPLNNQLANLRAVSHSENLRNIRSRGVSRYLGVHWHQRDGKWQAGVRSVHMDKTVYLGQYDDESEAARAYDRYCIENGLVTANLNFPVGGS